MKNRLKIDFHVLFPFLLTLVLWLLYYLQINKKINIAEFGVWPRTARGIPGIILHFFIHGNFGHILSNTLSLLVLTLLLFISYREIAFKVFMLMIPITGFLLWIIGRNEDHSQAICHIGASGVIFSLFGFLLTSGLIRKNKRLMALSALIIFLYGYMIWGIFPIEKEISWEGHASGLLTGIMLSFLFKNKGPAADKYSIQEEEEENDETIPFEEKYWLHNMVEKPEHTEKEKADVLNIIYDFVPKKIIDSKEKENN